MSSCSKVSALSGRRVRTTPVPDFEEKVMRVDILRAVLSDVVAASHVWVFN